MKKNKMLIMISVIVAAIILAVISFFILPETLVMQITTSGQAGNTLPKLLGLAIPFSISVIFSVLYYLQDERKKYLYFSFLGIVMSILTLLINM